ncbi:MAG: ACT domain-containing protein [Ruminococcaceae bacterium]|nr:ACT domain-containing protein [Oscillospiraceae bacterium]
MRAVITVVGEDKVGIFAKVSAFCAEHNVNIEGVSQTILDDMFCMIMIVEASKCICPFGDFTEKILEEGKKQGLVIHAMHEDIFNSMHRI